MTTVIGEGLTVAWHEQPMRPVWDPASLSGDQRSGTACVRCGKRWPRPTAPVGLVPDGTPVFACAECAPQLASRLERAALLQPVTARLLRLAAVAIGAALVDPGDVATAVHLAGDHTATPECGTGECPLCRGADSALVALATHLERTEILQVTVDPVDGDLERARAVIRAWADVDRPPAAVVQEALCAAAAELEAS